METFQATSSCKENTKESLKKEQEITELFI
jgi:hypothetical protein